MLMYIQRRLLLIVPTLLVVSLITFSLMRIMPGDPAITRLAETEAAASGDARSIERVRAELGLDKPLPVQYIDWLGRVLRLDFGRGFVSGRPVIEQLGPEIPVTLELAFLSSLLAIIVSLPLGIISALRQNHLLDYVARITAVVGLAIPHFWLGMLLILFLVLFFNWAPVEYVPIWQDPWLNLRHMLIPAGVLAFGYAAMLSRLTRSSMLEVLRQDYIRTADAKGLKSRTVVVYHALPNALIPVVTVMGLHFAHLIGGSVIMEMIFVLPGVGLHLLRAVNIQDYNTVQSIVFLLAVGVVLVNLLVDILYAVIDPRIRYG